MPRQRAVSDDLSDKARELARRRGPERGRDWDKANPTFCFRIRPEDGVRLAALASRLGVSRDALARGLMWAALDGAEAGHLALAVEELATTVEDKVGRVRGTVRRLVTPAWDFEKSPNRDDCSKA